MNSTFAAAENKLASLDQDWRSLLAEVGSCTLQPKQQSPYESLIRAVASQQLHSKAADAILARMLVMFDNQFPSPEQLTASDGEALRNCGFSRGKVATLQGIAAAALSGQVPDLSEAMEMTDWQLIQRLTALKGIGQWTVEMMLIFNLGRQDVLPVDDFAVREGYKRLKNISTITPKQLREIGEAWAPYRSVAAWYLWRVPKQAH
ncbi:MAG: DNA-3-methyladenine glycosylase 2 family protein [Methylophilaceae bacterium]|nr:DNA-3-methyladenine glycosylase 2 family protein [Methylophilaceae bacterium]